MAKKLKIINTLLIKEGIIRGNNGNTCPFGLTPISTVCTNVGDAIHRMAPIDIAKDKQETLTRANELVYINHKTGKQCPFADKVLDNYDKVDCDFGDTGQGEHSVGFIGSPLYPQTFTGIGLDGLYGYPLGFYADNNESRNLFFGLFSFLGKNDHINQLIKLANMSEEDDIKTSNKLDEIIEDLQNTVDKTAFVDKMKKLENLLSEYKQKYEDNRTDSGLLYQLADKWFGSRQVNR